MITLQCEVSGAGTCNRLGFMVAGISQSWHVALQEALQSLFFTLAFALGSRQPQLLSLVLSTASAVALVGIFLGNKSENHTGKKTSTFCPFDSNFPEIDSLANLCSGELVKALLMAYSSNADSRDFQT